MTGMNRLSPLIVRRVGPRAAALPFDQDFGDAAEGPNYLEDLKLFATGWIGGLVFFGTFIG